MKELFYKVGLISLFVCLSCSCSFDLNIGYSKVLIGTISENGFVPAYEISKKCRDRNVDLEYMIIPDEFNLHKRLDSNITFSRWVSYYYDEGMNYYADADDELAYSSGIFQVDFSRSVNVDITNCILADPFDDNLNEGKVELYVVFPKAEFEVEEDYFISDYTKHFYINGGGQLTYEFKLGDNEQSSTYFMIKNHGKKSERMKSGNDFVLNFVHEGVNGTSYSFNSGDTADYQDQINEFIDFFGIVDYKFLDEANLYIDEGKDDWNGELQEFYPVPSFTWHDHDQDENTNTTISNSVAYSAGAQDNPSEFNEKMEQQRICIEEFNRYAEENGIVVCPDDPDLYFTEWNTTTAPRRKWTYYVQAYDAIAVGFCTDESLVEFDSYKPEAGYPLRDIRPYVPGFSSMKELYGYTDFFYRGQSAGTDCIGFVQRSAGYDGNPYKLREIGDLYDTEGEHPWTWNDGWDEEAGGSRKYVEGRGELYYGGTDPDLSCITNIEEYNVDSSVLRKILPGDILYYRTGGYHVGIVDRVDYSDCKARSDIGLDDIKIIEATYGWDNINKSRFGNVINFHTVATYVSDEYDTPKQWRIGRLKQ